MGTSQKHHQVRSLKLQWPQILALSDTEYKRVMFQMAKDIKNKTLFRRERKKNTIKKHSIRLKR